MAYREGNLTGIGDRSFVCELIKNGFLICVRTNKDTSRSCHILNVTWKRKTESIVELISRKSQILAKKKNFVHFLNHHHQHSPSVCVVKSHIEDSHWPWRSPGRLLMLLNVENCPLMHQICGPTLANFQSRQVWKISLDVEHDMFFFFAYWCHFSSFFSCSERACLQFFKS